MNTGDIKKSLLAPAIAAGLAMAACAPPACAQTAAASPKVTMRDQAPIGLRTAAESGLRTMMRELTRGQAPGTRLPEDAPIAVATYGELQKVSLGIGFEVNTIDPAALMYAGANADLGRLTRPTGLWKFVILSQGRPVGLLEMDRVQGQWQAIGAGSSRLAEDVMAAAPKTGDGSFRFVRVYQARSDLLQVHGQDNRSRFVPMSSARGALALADTQASRPTLTSQDLLPSLQTAVRAGLQHGRH
jgi:hypothetical protein